MPELRRQYEMHFQHVCGCVSWALFPQTILRKDMIMIAQYMWISTYFRGSNLEAT